VGRRFLGRHTFSFSFPLYRGGFAFRADLRQAGKVRFSLVRLSLDVQLAKKTNQEKAGAMMMLFDLPPNNGP